MTHEQQALLARCNTSRAPIKITAGRINNILFPANTPAESMRLFKEWAAANSLHVSVDAITNPLARTYQEVYLSALPAPRRE